MVQCPMTASVHSGHTTALTGHDPYETLDIVPVHDGRLGRKSAGTAAKAANPPLTLEDFIFTTVGTQGAYIWNNPLFIHGEPCTPFLT